MLLVGNLLRYMYARNYQNIAWFAVLSSNEVDLHRYSTEVAFWYLLRSRFLQTFYL